MCKCVVPQNLFSVTTSNISMVLVCIRVVINNHGVNYGGQQECGLDACDGMNIITGLAFS